MPKIGLKIWSTNLKYIPVAQGLFSQKIFDYIELFVVPGSVQTIPYWKDIGIPYILHAPHSTQGLNPAVPSSRDKNMKLVQEVDDFFYALSPEFVIFHPGLNGKIEETIYQFKSWGVRFPGVYQKMIIENKPLVGLQDETCLGASPEEIRLLMDATQRGFCLDFGHAICYAVASKKDWKVVITEFLRSMPSMYHLCDGFYSVKDRHEHLGEGEFDLAYLAKLIDPHQYVSLETKKNSQDSLDDFVIDVHQLRKYAGI